MMGAFLPVLFGLLLFATPPHAIAKAVAATTPKNLAVIAITDLHGALLPESVATATGEKIQIGGAALLSSYVNAIRTMERERGAVVVIDAGDLFQGTMESNIPEGAPVIRFYNYLGVDAAAVGNHEFDFGPVGEKSIPSSPEDDPQGALKERIKEAHFPFLASNIVDESGKTPSWLKRSTVIERDGVKIGIVGAATPDTPNTTVRANLRGLTFLPPLEPVRAEAQRLRSEEKVDAVILTIHGGGGCKDNRDPLDLSSCEDGELFQLVRALPEGLINVAVGGHTHKGISKLVGKTAVLQSFSRGKNVSFVRLNLSESNEDPEFVPGYNLISVCSGFVPPADGEGPYTCDPAVIRKSKDPVLPATLFGSLMRPDEEVNKLLKPDFDRVRAIKEAPLGVKALETIYGSYGGESALGNLSTDIMREAISGADVSATNGGGLRAPLPQGPLNYGHIFEVMPFDNRTAILTVDGATLKRIVEIGHAGGHGSLSWSGLSFTACNCDVTGVNVGDQPYEPLRIYKVVTNDYLATGGSGFDRLHLAPEQIEILWNGPYILRDVVANTLKKWGRDLRTNDFYNKNAPRQKITGSCH